jgi:hypothetical protein
MGEDMTDRVTSPISVECHYGSGDRPLEAVVDSLIITKADAINRGYAELNKAWKIVDTYTVNMPYPDSGYLLEVGKHVKLTCPEIGLINQVLYIQGVSCRGTNTGTVITLKLERYEDYE